MAADSVMPQASISNLPLLLVEPNDDVPVPNYVKKLGGQAERYFRALETLAALDAYEAQVALRAFKSKAQDVSRMPVPPLLNPNLTLAVHRRNFWLNRIERSRVSRIYLDSGKRWKLDLFGMLALQLILWLWHFRNCPDPGKGLPFKRCNLPVFREGNSANRWWKYGVALLHDTRRKWCDEERVKALIPRSCQATSVTRNTYFLRKMRERFKNFAPPRTAKIYR